jgi:aspartate kinase
MPTIWKFGGACFSTRDRARAVARKIVDQHDDDGMVVVVSAKAGVTDQLTAEMRDANGDAASDALDLLLATGELQSAALLAAAITRLGSRACVVYPWEIFVTDDVPGDATIKYVHTGPIRARMDWGVVSVVPGFIGASQRGRIRTLGRGGSDYAAVALAGALGASEVCLFKADVDGFYTADPHTHRDARRFTSMSHRVALGLARAGARVLNEKAAEFADRIGLTLIIRPAFSDGPGTWVSPVNGSKPSGTTLPAGGIADEAARLDEAG